MKIRNINNKSKSWKKIFYTISAGQFFSILGSSMVQFTIIWWLTVETKSAIVLTFASLVGLLPQAILGPFIGAIVDRHIRKNIMIYSDMTIALATLFLMVLFILGKESLIIVYTVLLIRSVGSAFHMPAMQASIPMIVPDDNLSLAASVTQTIQAVSNIFGPALAAFMLGAVSIKYVLIVDVIGALMACSTVALVNIPNPEKLEEDNKNDGFIKEIMYGIKELRKYKGLFILTILLSINAVIYIPVGSLFPLIVSSHFNGGAYEAGIVEVAFAVGMLLGSILVGIIGEKYKKSNLISYSLVLLGTGLTISGVIPSNLFIIFTIMSATIGLSGPLFSTAYYVLLQNNIEPSVLGRVIGIVGSMMLFATPIGLLAAGPVSEIIGVSNWFFISGVVTIVLGVVCKFIKVKVD